MTLNELKRIKELTILIKILNRKKQAIYGLHGTPQGESRQGKGKISNVTLSAVEQIFQVEGEIEKATQELNGLLEILKDNLCKLDYIERQIIEMRYINQFYWAKISSILNGQSLRQLYRIHEKAVQKLEQE